MSSRPCSQAELSGKVGHAASKVASLQQAVTADLASASQSLASAAAADEARAMGVASELQAAASASRLSELQAHEGRERAEAKAAALEARVAAQAKLVVELLQQQRLSASIAEDEEDEDGAKRAELAEEKAQRLLQRAADEAQREALHARAAYARGGMASASEASASDEEVCPSSSSAGDGLLTSLAGSVQRVASAARSYVTSPASSSPFSSADAKADDGEAGRGGADGSMLSLIEGRYVACVEEELLSALRRLATQQAVCAELEGELGQARDELMRLHTRAAIPSAAMPLIAAPDPSDASEDASGSSSLRGEDFASDLGEEERAQAEALAAAEAAADALFMSDGIGGGASPLVDAWKAAPGRSHARSNAGDGGDGVVCGGEGDDMGPLAELRQRGAASSLVEELRLESAKSARLEKIISKLMGELRAAKLHAAATGGGQRALLAFEAAAARLEAQLRDNATSVGALEVTLRKGLETVAERLSAVACVDKSATAGRASSSSRVSGSVR